ncbi:MAG TPA: M48 family metallopeptidase [Verrucomicrobiae bacterium]|nr:M48 family metallopeptidase [Verrucomicrobiae bacterium]
MNHTAHSVEASLFHPDSGDEPVGGRILIGRTQVQFQSETISIGIATENLEIEFEKGGKGIFLDDSTQPEMRIYTLDHSILRHPAIKSLPQIASVLGRREVTRALRLTVYFAVGCVVLTWLGSIAMSAMTRAIAARVPMEWEQKMGAAQMDELKESGMLLDDSNSVAQLTALAAPLIKVLPPERRNLKFYISKDPTPNAFALPGGHVVVNEGLLELTDKPDELLGVLAHELTHQAKRHAIRRSIAAAGPLVIFGVFLRSNSGIGNILAVGSGLMVFQGFSQEYETEADDGGWDYLVAANIDPRGFIRAMQKLEATEEKTGMQHIVPQAFQSHPATEKRIARLQGKWDKLARKTGFIELQPVTWSFKKPEQSQ